jgi:hypothetical protein
MDGTHFNSHTFVQKYNTLVQMLLKNAESEREKKKSV